MSIVVTDLTKSYGDQKAINSISFTAEPGEILGLLGPNGAGKTTTMKILTCYAPPSHGEAFVCGLKVGEEDKAIKRKIGYLPEHNPLYPSMYIKEYLSFVASIHKVPNKKNRIEDVIQQVGLQREQKKKISELSKGYKQRVGIAQALLHDPEVLILDEPISGLDPNQLLEVRTLIEGLKKDKTIIFSSHILQEVESICDKVVILDRGMIVADDSLGQLKSSNAGFRKLLIELKKDMDLALLEGISGVHKVEKHGSNKFILSVDGETDVRDSVFDKVVEQQNKIYLMSYQDQSLESVFKELTK